MIKVPLFWFVFDLYLTDLHWDANNSIVSSIKYVRRQNGKGGCVKIIILKSVTFLQLIFYNCQLIVLFTCWASISFQRMNKNHCTKIQLCEDGIITSSYQCFALQKVFFKSLSYPFYAFKNTRYLQDSRYLSLEFQLNYNNFCLFNYSAAVK